MGPPPFGDGNPQTGNLPSLATSLQWGHRLSAMEIGREYGAPSDVQAASMGPPPFGDGNSVSALERAVSSTVLQWGHRLSAMEIWGVTEMVDTIRRLQWGHRLSAMEIALAKRHEHRKHKLQWGHRLSAMEIRGVHAPEHRADLASMGPPPFGDGNRAIGIHTATPATGFNGATAFRRWKFGLDEVGECWHGGFNGATAFRRWKSVSTGSPGQLEVGFNGATAFRRWK